MISILVLAAFIQVDDRPDFLLDPGNLGLSLGYGASIHATEDFIFVSSPAFAVGAERPGKVDVWRVGRSGYEHVQELTPTACFTTGTNACLFATEIASSAGWLALSSLGGDPLQASTAGLVHLYRLAGDEWRLQQILRPVPHAAPVSTGFGAALSIDGDELLVGASGFRSGSGRRGAIHEYRLDPAMGAVLQGSLTAPIGSDEAFGRRIARSGNLLAVGALFSVGSVSVFERSGAGWSLLQILERPLGSSLDYRFGQAVSFAQDGEILLVGDPNISTNERDGRVFVYTRSAGVGPFTLVQALEGQEGSGIPMLGNQFGRSISVSGVTMAVGSPAQSVLGVRLGCCELFELVGGAWEHSGRFTVPHASMGANAVGIAADLQGGRLYASDPAFSNGSTGPTGGVYGWEINDAVEICTATPGGRRLSAIRSGAESSRFDIIVDGLSSQEWSIIAIGDAVRSAPGTIGSICISSARRASQPVQVEPGSSRIVFRNTSTELRSGLRSAVQVFTRVPPGPARFVPGPAVIIFE